MSEGPSSTADRAAAGALLRAARQKQGLHIAALAASIKVAPAKLEALEAGRYEELPDATFTRALAQSICRVLKIDAQPVLALLPSSRAATLEKVDAGLNTPFRERPGRIDPTEWPVWHQPAFWLVLVLLAAAVAFVMVPGQWTQRWLPTPAPDGALSGGSTPSSSPAGAVAAASSTVPDALAPAQTTSTVVPNDTSGIASSPASAADATRMVAAASAAASAPIAGASAPGGRQAAQLRAVQATWVQAVDARGTVLLSRLVSAGESVEIDGARPLRLRIGNVRGTELYNRGQPVDLASGAQSNVANVELP